MEKYKRYSGVCLFVLIFCLLAFGSYLLLTPKFQDLSTKRETLSKKEAALSALIVLHKHYLYICLFPPV